MRLALVLFALALPGCGSRPAPRPEPVPASSTGVVIVEANATVSTGTGTSTGTSTGTAPPPATCRASLRVYDLRVRPGCTIDERVSGAPGVLEYPCGGGPASATFGASRFSGVVSASGDVELEIRTAFHFSDGCDWETKQFLRGNVGSGALSYEYREEPEPGQAGCAAACVSTGSVAVTR